MTFRVHRAIADFTAEQWQACLQADHPFLNHAFLAALESSGSVGGETGWVPFHLALWDGGELLACAPAFLKTHSYGEYVFDWLWAEAYEHAGGRYYPKLLFGVPFTPVPGPRLLVSSQGATRLGAATARRQLVRGAQELLKHYHLSSCHALFLREAADREAFAQIGALSRFGLQYHWHGRDDCPDWAGYLARMRAPKRKQIKRERAAWSAYRFAWRTGRDLQDPAALTTFYEHYASTYDRKWGAPYLRPAFFDTLFRSLPEAVRCLCCFHDGVWCASALNYISWEEKALFGRHWGSSQEPTNTPDSSRLPGQPSGLHFECCYYQALDFAFRHGLARHEAGVQGHAHKLARGYAPVLTHSAHYFVQPALGEAVETWLRHERALVRAQYEAGLEALPWRREENKTAPGDPGGEASCRSGL